MHPPTTPTAGGLALRSLSAVVGAAAYVVAIGYLALHAEAAKAGAVLAWDGTITSLAPPTPPLWSSVGVVVLVAVAFLLAWRSHATASSRRGKLPLWTATLTLIVLSAYLMATSQLPFSAFVAVSGIDASESMPAVVAWARQGALSSATYAVTGVMLVLSFLRPGRRTALRSDDEPAAGATITGPDHESGVQAG